MNKEICFSFISLQRRDCRNPLQFMHVNGLWSIASLLGPLLVVICCNSFVLLSYVEAKEWSIATAPPTGPIKAHDILPATEWDVHTIESSVSAEARNSSLAVDSLGMVHVLYYDEPTNSQNELKYARQTPSGWDIQVVDNAKGDQTVIRIDSYDRLHIAYNDIRSREQVRYGILNGSDWVLEDVHPSSVRGRNPMLVLDRFDQPHMAFQDNGGMGYATFYTKKDESSWAMEQVGSSTLLGGFGLGSIELGSDDTPYLFGGGRSFRVATRSDSLWTIESGLGPSIFSPNMSSGLDADGNFHVSGVTLDDDDLIHLVGSANDWSYTIIEHTGPIGLSNTSVAFGPNDRPSIAYEVDLDGSGRTRIKHARFTGSQWTTDFVSQDTAVQSGTSLNVDGEGVAHLVYWAQDGRLVYATAQFIPEPTSLVLSFFALPALLCIRGRRHVKLSEVSHLV